MTSGRLTWNQPVCEACWIANEGDWETCAEGVRLTAVRVPVIVPAERSLEQCCFCGAPTIAGIFQRIDPATVRFPRVEGGE